MAFGYKCTFNGFSTVSITNFIPLHANRYGGGEENRHAHTKRLIFHLYFELIE